MKPKFDQPTGALKNSSHQNPPSSQKEGPASSQTNDRQEGKTTFIGSSSRTSYPPSRSYVCQCRLNTNGVQDCSQYARKEDYPYYAGASNGTGTEEQDSGQQERVSEQENGWQLRGGGKQDTENQQVVSCQRISNQQTQQQNADGPAKPNAIPLFENNATIICMQSQEERGTLSRKQSCRPSTPAASVPAHSVACTSAGVPVPVPRPKVMCVAPPFEGTAVYKGDFLQIKLSDYRGRYLCLLFYPLDFTFVCPTEILAMSDIYDQFKEVNCAVLGCSCDSIYTHLAFMKTSRVNNGLGEIAFPLLSDFTKRISTSYNVLTEEGAPERALFIIDPLGIIRSITINDAGVGRNTDEVLRMVQAIKSVDDFDEMCPNGWIPGSISVVPTRTGALNYYRQMYSPKIDKKNRKTDQRGSACSSHITYEQEKMDML